MSNDQNTQKQQHNWNGWAKRPSRRGGLMSPTCTCGWAGRAQLASEGYTSFYAHRDEASA